MKEEERKNLVVLAAMAAILFAGNLVWNFVHFIPYQDMHYYNMVFSGIFLGVTAGLLLRNKPRNEG